MLAFWHFHSTSPQWCGRHIWMDANQDLNGVSDEPEGPLVNCERQGKFGAQSLRNIDEFFQ